MVTTADFHRLEASWRSLSQLSDPSLTLTALMHAYEAAFDSWGRHAASVLEVTRVSVFLRSLSQRYRDYLGMPGSPLRAFDAAPSFRDCCAWLRSFERFEPSDDDLHSPRLVSLGATPVVAAGRGGRAGGRAGRGRGHVRCPLAEDDPRLRCVRCLQRGHAASCCETTLRPATVRANVLRCWEALRDGVCFVCSSMTHLSHECPVDLLPVEILAIWPADAASDHGSDLSADDAAPLYWPGRAASASPRSPSMVLTVAFGPWPARSPPTAAAQSLVATRGPPLAAPFVPPPPHWAWGAPSDFSSSPVHSDRSTGLTDYYEVSDSEASSADTFLLRPAVIVFPTAVARGACGFGVGVRGPGRTGGCLVGG